MPFDSFLKLDGIKGESTDSKHKDEIEVLSYSWGISKTGRPLEVEALTFTTRYSAASPPLFLKCATGEAIKEGLLTLRRAGAQQLEFLKIKLGEILVSSYETAGDSGGELNVPLEQIALNFDMIEFEYSRQKEDGSLDSPIRAAFDLSKAKRI